MARRRGRSFKRRVGLSGYLDNRGIDKRKAFAGPFGTAFAFFVLAVDATIVALMEASFIALRVVLFPVEIWERIRGRDTRLRFCVDGCDRKDCQCGGNGTKADLVVRAPLQDVPKSVSLPEYDRSDNPHQGEPIHPDPTSSPPIRTKDPLIEIERLRREYEAQQAKEHGENHAALDTHDNLDRGAAKANSASLYPSRTGRAPVEPRIPISQILESEMIALLRWIETDGKRRTDKQLFDEAFSYLRYSRRSPRIEQRIAKGIAQFRGQLHAPFTDPFN